jgi:2-methylcitrate dehydratase
LFANGHESIGKINVTAYQPAFGIIGDPAKKNPTTRQSADHSMAYIISTLIRKAIEKQDVIRADSSLEEIWKALMLSPYDYGYGALYDKTTRALM